MRARLALALGLACAMPALHAAAPITLASLLEEMADTDRLAHFPSPAYRSLQATSYNRASVRRGEPGWFADSDGTGFIRAETTGPRTEWVIMEHEGPGAITRFWTPFFYYDFNRRTGPSLKVYLDGSDAPAIDTPLIHLVTERSFVKIPFAIFTARAGVACLPIPFARRCKVTLDQKPFYYSISYRAYPPGTDVRSFSMEEYRRTAEVRDRTAAALLDPPPASGNPLRASGIVGHNRALELRQVGGGAIRELSVRVDPEVIAHHPELLRSLILILTFDGEQTAWCPLGDFFSSANAIHSFQTWIRRVTPDHLMTARWVMPFRKTARVRLLNLRDQPVQAELSAHVAPWRWDDRSMHFHASWRPDDVLPGTPFVDWNFIEIFGKGAIVGDSFTVLSPGRGWWGEGDEKIYVDDAWDNGFPTHFGTGTEDYYGWAGGRVPDRRDIFSMPFGANVSVGSTAEDNPRGINICTRVRALDAIPFERRLVFDMEASPGVDIRHAWNLLGYSAVVFWCALPGARSNRPPRPAEAVRPLMALEELDRRQQELRSQFGVPASTGRRKP